MDNSIIIAGIIALVVIIVSFIFRDSLKQLFIQINERGLTGRVETNLNNDNVSQKISANRNKLTGNENSVDVAAPDGSNVSVDDNEMQGNQNTLKVNVRNKK